MATIGQRIKSCRKEAGMTQQFLGEKLGVLKQQIYNYETNKNYPPVIRLVKMGKIFKRTINWLATGKEN